jgi:hypothetical protein
LRNENEEPPPFVKNPRWKSYSVVVGVGDVFSTGVAVGGDVFSTGVAVGV